MLQNKKLIKGIIMKIVIKMVGVINLQILKERGLFLIKKVPKVGAMIVLIKVMLKMKEKKKVTGAIHKIIFNLHKDLKEIIEVEIEEAEEDRIMAEVEEVVLNVDKKVIFQENVQIKIIIIKAANKKEWEGEEVDLTNVIIVTNKVICLKIALSLKKKELEEISVLIVIIKDT